MRYDYILPCAALCSNIVGGQVFRTDLLTPPPANLYSDDDQIASDHLPVFMVFANPFNVPFRLLAISVAPPSVSLKWESTSNCIYSIEVSSNLTAWTPWAVNLVASSDSFIFTTNLPDGLKFFRVQRQP